MQKTKERDLMIVLCGKSAVGKSTVLNKLIESHHYKNVISDTTRPMRDNEKEGIDYYFINKNQFEEKLQNKMYCSIRHYTTLLNNKPDVWYYGIEKKELDDKYKKICIVDIQGLENIISYYGKENLLIIYLDASDKLRKKRAKIRPNFSIYEWKRRLLDDNEQFNNEIIEKYVNCIISTEKNSLEDIIEQINDTYIYTLINNLSKILNTNTKTGNINENNNDK